MESRSVIQDKSAGAPTDLETLPDTAGMSEATGLISEVELVQVAAPPDPIILLLLTASVKFL